MDQDVGRRAAPRRASGPARPRRRRGRPAAEQQPGGHATQRSRAARPRSQRSVGRRRCARAAASAATSGGTADQPDRPRRGRAAVGQRGEQREGRQRPGRRPRSARPGSARRPRTRGRAGRQPAKTVALGSSSVDSTDVDRRSPRPRAPARRRRWRRCRRRRRAPRAGRPERRAGRSGRSRRRWRPRPRSWAGTTAAQIAARPLPTAIAGPPTSTASSSDQPSARGVDGAVCGRTGQRRRETVDERRSRPRRQAMATGTVQSRSPSEIWSESGPWPEIESPTRWPIRQTSQPRDQRQQQRHGGHGDARPPRTPEPWAISQARAPTRSASRGCAVGAGVGEEPAGDAERRGRRPAGCPPRRPLPRVATEHQRTSVPGVDGRERVGGREPRAAKSWPGHPRAPATGFGAPTPKCSRAPPQPVWWIGHEAAR